MIRVLVLAWKSIMMHRLRSLLTVLGIVFGVTSVVLMLAIGEGASLAAQEQIRRMGSRNLLLASIAPPQSDDASQGNTRVAEYGLKHEDVRRIREVIPGIERMVARRDIPVEARVGARKYATTMMGTTAEYAEVANLEIALGRFLTAADGRGNRPVCVLGAEVARRFFRSQNPVGRRIRAEAHYFDVVGVLERRGEGTGGTAGTGGESDDAIYIPLETMQERWGSIVRTVTTGSRSYVKVELHRITVEATSLAAVPRIASALNTMIERWHPKDDVKLTVPLDLLREAEETKRRSTFLLGSIAAISLIVGGIGIMNIMLATVVERTREIGIRRALGARRGHIIRQFLAETVLLSVGGGAIGLILGILGPIAITKATGMPTSVTPFSLVLAFGISALVGVIFGLYPAAQAADLNPVEALRRE